MDTTMEQLKVKFLFLVVFFGFFLGVVSGSPLSALIWILLRRSLKRSEIARENSTSSRTKVTKTMKVFSLV
jgi:hypothetical protein